MTRRGLLGLLVALPVAPVLVDRMAEVAEDASDRNDLELTAKRYTDAWTTTTDSTGEYLWLAV